MALSSRGSFYSDIIILITVVVVVVLCHMVTFLIEIFVRCGLPKLQQHEINV